MKKETSWMELKRLDPEAAEAAIAGYLEGLGLDGTPTELKEAEDFFADPRWIWLVEDDGVFVQVDSKGEHDPWWYHPWGSRGAAWWQWPPENDPEWQDSLEGKRRLRNQN